MSKIELHKGDCLEVMDELIAKGVVVDAVICDPPYGTTACSWDSVIPLEPMWDRLNKLIKPNGAIVMTASQPFTTTLIASNIKNYAHQWVWNKRFAANFVQAKRQPLKDHEDVLVFSTNGKQPVYFPQMVKRVAPIKKGGNKQSKAIPIAETEHSKSFGKSNKSYDKKNPTTITSLEFSVRDGRGLHPTQKPVALMEYLIKTYTKEGETVLDFTCGSGTTGVAAANTSRNFIGIELDDNYFEIAKKRIEEATTGKEVE